MSEQIAEPLNDLVVDISTVKPRGKNPRRGDVEVIKESLKVNGQYRPIVVNKNNGEVLAGNHTLKAATALGWQKIAVTYVDADEEEAARIVLVDNRANDLATYENNTLIELLQEFEDLSGTGYSNDELEQLLKNLSDPEEYDGKNDPDDVPEPKKDPKTKPGDIWQLGPHRLMCGDSTNSEHLASLMAGESAHLLHADPPYGMGKEKDGVLNDNLYKAKLDKFQLEWWNAARQVIDDNAGVYIWGNAPDLWRLWYSAGLGESEALTLCNEIVWQKPSAIGMKSELMRSYPVATERCLFFMLGKHSYQNNAEDYWDGWEPLRTYLDTEMEKCGGRKAWKEALGNHMGSHYFTKSQWTFPTEEAYTKLQTYGAKHQAFERAYEDLRAEYEALKGSPGTPGTMANTLKTFYDSRTFFDNSHDVMHDVWEFDRVSGEDRHEHATPKPVTMMERIMKSSLDAGGLCFEPFAGSGSTLIGAERTGRVCYTMELDPVYCDVVVQRWEDHTGNKAKLETGRQA